MLGRARTYLLSDSQINWAGDDPAMRFPQIERVSWLRGAELPRPFLFFKIGKWELTFPMFDIEPWMIHGSCILSWRLGLRAANETQQK